MQGRDDVHWVSGGNLIHVVCAVGVESVGGDPIEMHAHDHGGAFPDIGADERFVDARSIASRGVAGRRAVGRTRQDVVRLCRLLHASLDRDHGECTQVG
eukprot:scaffold25384_cov129-Isochrysis_galbana.AAC.3